MSPLRFIPAALSLALCACAVSPEPLPVRLFPTARYAFFQSPRGGGHASGYAICIDALGRIVVAGSAEDRKGKILFINASAEFQKGRPKNFLPEETVKRLSQVFHEGKDVEHLLKIVELEEITANDFNLSPSRYITSLAPTEHRDIQTLLDELAKHQREAQALDHELADIFTGLGYRWGGEA